MVTVKMWNLNTNVLEAFIKVITKHHDANLEYHEPNVPRTAEITIEGKGAEGFVEDLKSFCSQLRWNIELQ